MKKIVLPIILSIVIAFSGCSKREEDPNTVTLWHWMTDRHSELQELATRYKEKTGIHVDVQIFAPSDPYSKKIVASAQSKILPDIYGVLDTKETLAKYIQYGYVADLTDHYMADDKAWYQTFFPKAMASSKFEENNVYGVKPGFYEVPLDVTNIQMLYNKKLLNKAGVLKPPENINEFFAAIEALNRVGIQGLVSGWGERWLINCFAMNYAINVMGEEKLFDTFRGKVSYTDPDWLKVFNLFKDLRDNEALISGIVIKTNKDAEQDFALERAAFAFNGSWSVNVYHEMNPELDYGVMLPPVLNMSRPMLVWGWAGSPFVVNKASPRKEKAIEFLKWLTQAEQQTFLSAKTRNLPANKNSIVDIPPILEQFAKVMDQTTHPKIWPLNESAIVKERFDKGLQAILIGKKTPEIVASEIQEAKIKDLKKHKAN